MIAQLDELLEEFSGLKARTKYDDLSDLPTEEVVRFNTRARAGIERLAGNPSAYFSQCESIVTANSFPGHKAVYLAGVVDS